MLDTSRRSRLGKRLQPALGEEKLYYLQGGKIRWYDLDNAARVS